MQTYSRLLNKYYDPANESVVYLTNFQQIFKYLNASEEVADDLLDILYTGTRKDCLVFVFRKSPIIKELYKKWQNHELD